MSLADTKCIKCMDLEKRCATGNIKMVKHGFSSIGKQRYKCRSCNKTEVNYYSYQAYTQNINQLITRLTIEGLGVRSTARVLHISTTTLLKRIVAIASKIRPPIISKRKVYEVDELHTYVRNKKKLIWFDY